MGIHSNASFCWVSAWESRAIDVAWHGMTRGTQRPGSLAGAAEVQVLTLRLGLVDSKMLPRSGLAASNGLIWWLACVEVSNVTAMCIMSDYLPPSSSLEWNQVSRLYINVVTSKGRFNINSVIKLIILNMYAVY